MFAPTLRTTSLRVAGTLAVALALAATDSARAQCTTNGDCLLPLGCGYAGAPGAPIPIAIPAPLGLRNLQFTNPETCTPPPTAGTMDSFFDIFIEVSLDGGTSWTLANGRAHTMTRFDRVLTPVEPQTFDTEMLQLDLMGGLPGGVLMRESPTMPSQGRTTIEQVPGGQHRIDSFFDIFIEISIDGGMTWNPPSAPYRTASVPMGPVATQSSAWSQVKLLFHD